jgi:hypothetical protein
MRLVRSLATIAVLVFCNPTNARADASGAVAGNVIDDQGAPVANATVLLQPALPAPQRSLPGSASMPRSSSRVATDKNGRLLIGDLIPGPYYLCAYGVQGIHLSSCEWTDGPQTVQVVSGQTVQGVTMHVVQGSKLLITIDDPKGLINDPAGSWLPGTRAPLKAANFRIGIMVGTRYTPAIVLSSEQHTRTYQLVIPTHLPVQLLVWTTLVVVDTNGATVSSGKPGAPINANGQGTVAIHLRIS